MPAQKPNPALHLTPPADVGRIAHRVMAVQVSSLFGKQKAHSWESQMAVWRLIAHHADPDAQIQAFLDLGWIAIGWTHTGDLRQSRPASAGIITQLIVAGWPESSNAQLGGPSLWRFYHEMGVGDLVILGDGNRRRSVVRVAGDYTFLPADRAAAFLEYGHLRRAEPVACDPEAVWQGCGAGFAEGESARWTLARLVGGGAASRA